MLECPRVCLGITVLRPSSQAGCLGTRPPRSATPATHCLRGTQPARPAVPVLRHSTWPPRHTAPTMHGLHGTWLPRRPPRAPSNRWVKSARLLPTPSAPATPCVPQSAQILTEESCTHWPRRSSQRIAASTVRADPRRGELHAPYSQILADPRRGELHPPSPQILASGGWPIAHTYTSDLRAPVRESPHLGALFHVRGHVFHTGPVRAPGRQTAPPFHRITIGRAAGRLITPMMPGKQQIKRLCSRYSAHGPPR